MRYWSVGSFSFSSYVPSRIPHEITLNGLPKDISSNLDQSINYPISHLSLLSKSPAHRSIRPHANIRRLSSSCRRIHPFSDINFASRNKPKINLVHVCIRQHPLACAGTNKSQQPCHIVTCIPSTRRICLYIPDMHCMAAFIYMYLR